MEIVKISKITEFLNRRQVMPVGVEFLKESIKQNGFLDNNPVVLISIDNGCFKLIDGRHRLEASIELEKTEIPAIIKDGLSDIDQYQLASQCNNAAETVVPSNFVSDAEFIWARESEYTQSEIATMLAGWSRSKVSQYSMLKKINISVWDLIATEFKKMVATTDGEAVASSATVVAITERLLRDILCLHPDQQLNLISRFINNKITKAEFKKNAINHKTQNSINEYVEELLKGLDKDSISRCLKTAENGMYSREWKENKKAGEKLNSLVQSFIDEWEKKHCFNLFNGDFTIIMPEEIEADSLDYIITDPPYPKEYISLYEDIAKEAARSLKPGGSLIVMAGQSYIPEIMSLMCKHLSYQWILAHLTPGGQSVQLFQRKVNTFFKPLLWFVKGDYKGKWIGDVTKSKTNDNDKRFHEWGQSESGMLDIIKRFTEPGDMICDPFLGGGTIGIVALSENRKFVGIEKDKDVFNTAKERIERSLNE